MVYKVYTTSLWWFWGWFIIGFTMVYTLFTGSFWPDRCRLYARFLTRSAIVARMLRGNTSCLARKVASNPSESHVISGKRLQFAIGNGHRKFVDLLKIVISHGHVSLPGNIWSLRPQLIPIQGMKWNGSDVKRRPGCESRSFAIWVAGHLVVLPLTPNGNPQWKPPMETPSGNPQWKHMETMDIPPMGNHGLALVRLYFQGTFKRDGRIPAGRCDDTIPLLLRR